ncbi:MAG: filamentous hemagglutinin family protein [bacterium]
MIKGFRKNKLRGKGVVFFMVFNLCLVHLPAFGEPLIPGYYGSKNLPPPLPNTLPQVKMEAGQIKADGIKSVVRTSDNQLTVYQEEKDAVISWESFNIGKDAHVHFDQDKQTSWTVLNRIFDHSPSQIFGRLTADGKVYLINQNGILFGPGSRVNVHSLIASSLNLHNDDFMDRENKDFKKKLWFRLENYQDPSSDPPSDAVVSNHGQIETEYGGSVFLFGSSVENHGIIESPAGQIGLAAGCAIELVMLDNPDPARLGYLVKNRAEEEPAVDVEGEAVNFESGQLISDLGLAGMYGRTIRQEGLIRSVRAVQRNGNIELLASEKVTTGEKSITACSISDSQEKVIGSSLMKSEINIGGWTPEPNPKPEDTPSLENTSVDQIEHKGIIIAPSGTVNMRALDKVYLGEGSVIDVSGLWAALSAEDHILKVKLNSVELRDDFGQKYGPLKETTISFNAYTGSSIGNVSNSLDLEEKTAIENCTEGGKIEVEALSGDIIFKKGASLDFSGGGIFYAQSFGSTTKVLAGNKIYDISAAPQWIHYDKVLDTFYEEYPRFGVKIPYKGLYYGGVVPILDYLPSHFEGHDAGSLFLRARRIVLDGRLDGSVTRGVFQTQLSTPLDEFGYETISKGAKQPQGGSLQIGDYYLDKLYPVRDLCTNEIVIQPEVQPLEDLGPDDQLSDTYISRISEHQINETGLFNFSVYSNIGITTEKDTRIALPAGGFFDAAARSIVHQGEISVPCGMIKLNSDSNFTSDGGDNPLDLPENLPEGIHIKENSALIASGEKIDYLLPLNVSRVNGGTITLIDRGIPQSGIHIEQGSLLDVSGGYTINGTGKIKGGDAGTLELRSLRLSLNGDLHGHSLCGQSGGTLSLHTGEIRVIPENSLQTENTGEELILSDNAFTSTGFTHIKLISEDNIQITDGSVLTPSQAKLPEPLLKITSSSSQPAHIGLGEEPDPYSSPYVMLPLGYLGPSSITCIAGESVDRENKPASTTEAELKIDSGAKVQTSPGGKIKMKANITTIAGCVESLAGTISISADEHDLTLEETGRIIAAGFNKQDEKPLADGLPYGSTPLPGGSVKLEASKVDSGNLYLKNGCLIDVSGSEPTFILMGKNDGTYESLPAAGSAGSITLAFGGNINPSKDNNDKIIQGRLEGVKLIGHAKMEGVTGGELILEQNNSNHGLSLYVDDMKRVVQKGSLDQSGGFDALVVRSRREIDFEESLSLTPQRSLILDAPLLKASGAENLQIYLRSPWLCIMNSDQYNTEPLQKGGALIRCAGNWIDIKGDIQFSDFQDVHLKSEHDLTLSDTHNLMKIGDNFMDFGWRGNLNTAGDLTLEAERIYPTTLSQFTIHSDQKVTILPGKGTPTSHVYSAGGKLTIEAQNIEHRGTLAAPMGEIILCQTEETGEATDRIYLAAGSKITTTGETPVNYGELSISSWTIPDKSDKANPNKTQEALIPHDSVSLNGSEVILDAGAQISVDGGGSIFAYQFLPGIEGTENPLSREGRYVIFPDNSIVRPGRAIYLEGVSGVSEGVYSLLPEEFAFLPGAMIITDLGVYHAYDTSLRSNGGSPVTRGFPTIRDSGYTENVPHLYAVSTGEKEITAKQEGNLSTMQIKMTAGDAEGYFNQFQMTAGDAGRISIKGDTSILEGAMSGKPFQDPEHPEISYEGNLIELSGKTIFIGQSYNALLPEFSFDDQIPEDLKDKLYVDVSALSAKGFKEISLGHIEKNGEEYQGTEYITVQEGAHLFGTNLTLSATKGITVQPGAQLNAEAQKDAEGHIPENEGHISLISPKGKVTIAKDALLESSHALNLECQNLTVASTDNIQVKSSTLNLMSDRIAIVSDLSLQQNETDFAFTPEELNRITKGFTHIILTGRTELVFQKALEFHLGDVFLTLDTPKITGLLEITDLPADELTVKITGREITEGDTVRYVPLKKISLLNTTDNLPGTGSTLSNTGTLSLDAEEIVIGNGDIFLEGFRIIDLKSKNNLTLSGIGSITAKGDELNITAARVTTSPYLDKKLSPQNQDLPYEVARFTINAPAGKVTINGNSEGTKGESTVPGGTLNISANDIILNKGIIEVQSGQITLHGNGSGEGQGIFLKDHSQILAQGSDYASGGKVSLSTEVGQIDMADNTLIDVSAGAQGDAGTLSLYAPKGTVVLDGDIKGDAGEKETEEEETTKGLGGRFILDADRFGIVEGKVDLSQLNDKVKSGGFDHSIDLRFRSGDITLPEDTQMMAHTVKVVADGGKLDVFGTIKAPSEGSETGRVELYSLGNLALDASAIDQTGDETTGIFTPGGEVILSTAQGDLILKGTESKNVLIDAEEVTFRALRQDQEGEVRLNVQKTTVQGASEVIVEPVKVYGGADFISEDGTIINRDAIASDTKTFMTVNTASIKDRLLADGILSLDDDNTLHIRPGIEISDNGSLSLSSDWNLNDWYHEEPGTPPLEPGTLFLRAGDNLNINGNLFDKKITGDSSWRLNLAAGADSASADPLAVIKGKGNLIIADEKAVYTKYAPISFASGNDTIIGRLGRSSVMFQDIEITPFNKIPFNIASENNRIHGMVTGSLEITGGAIQTRTGDIQIEIGKDLHLISYYSQLSKSDLLGSIRTVGEPPSESEKSSYWKYTNGGDINIDVGGSIGDRLNKTSWDNAYNDPKEGVTAWSASYDRDKSTQGLATMGGGNLRVSTGGDFLGQIGAFGPGDVAIFSGGDIYGKFLVKQGEGYYSAMGNIGANSALHNQDDLTLEVFDSKMSLIAQGNIKLGTIVNPSIVRDGFNGDAQWNLTYSPESRVTLRALTEDVNISGNIGNLVGNPSNIRNTILPPTLEVYAQRDIRLSGDFCLAPSKTGNLVLKAGRDIDGLYYNGQFKRSSILLSDLDPGEVFGRHPDNKNTIAIKITSPSQHADNPIHEDDPVPVSIQAGAAYKLAGAALEDGEDGGDIRDVNFVLPKKAEIDAFRNISDIWYQGQNILPEDTSHIRAGADITFSSSSLVNGVTGIEHGGPGFLLVQAGNSIDLGVSRGIQSVGHYYNPALGQKKSSLAVVSGYDLDMDNDKINTFFNELKPKADEYCRLLNEEGADPAEEYVNEKIRGDLINPTFQSEKPGDGHINLFDSQINASGEKGDLFIIARGIVNVGRTTFSTDENKLKNSGIYTAAGGKINVFAGSDVNVNESRLMTFRGGDILIWSDFGNINAGRGSKTAINTEPPKIEIIDGVAVIKFEPPAVGSGIRTLTYDPDGLEGPKGPPDQGDVFLYAPKGEIDAGEAEIVGRNVAMAAQSYKNVQNISFSGSSTGVPSVGDSSANIGALTGSGNLMPQTKLTEESSVADTAAKRMTSIKEAMKAFSLDGDIDVKVIGFEEKDEGKEDKKEKDKEKENGKSTGK